MIAYSREEIFSTAQMAKKWEEILKKLGNKEISKAAISKNNTIEAILLPVAEYEKMKTAFDNTEMKGTGKRQSFFGSAKGLIVMGEKFDEPVEEFLLIHVNWKAAPSNCLST